MKSRFVFSFHFIVLFLVCTSLSAQQKEYVVNLNNDTLYGDVIFKGMGNVTLGQNMQTTSYSPKELKSFRSGNGYYYSILRPGNKRPDFLHCIEYGKIRLYEYTTTSYASYYSTSIVKLYYATKDSLPLFEMSAGKKKVKEAFRKLIEDNHDLVAQFDQQKSFRIEDVQYYIHEYNK
jgi:hypothetical protein